MMNAIGVRITKAASWFVLSVFALFTVHALVFSDIPSHGYVAMVLINSAAIGGFLIQRYAILAGVGWGYCLWFYAWWILGIGAFAYGNPPIKFGPMVGDMLGEVFKHSIVGVLPYLIGLFLEWLRSGKSAPEIITERGYSLPSESASKETTTRIKCQNCATENSSTARFCASCGAKIDGTLICAGCGIALVDGQKFCGGCGKKVHS